MAKEVKSKGEKKCRSIISNKQRMIKSTHNWVISLDPRYSVCQDCGLGKRN